MLRFSKSHRNLLSSVLLLCNLQGLYNIARSANAVMFESNVHCNFSNGSEVITERLFGFPLIPDDEIVTNDSVAVGFDCGSPPEPLVS